MKNSKHENTKSIVQGLLEERRKKRLAEGIISYPLKLNENKEDKFLNYHLQNSKKNEPKELIKNVLTDIEKLLEKDDDFSPKFNKIRQNSTQPEKSKKTIKNCVQKNKENMCMINKQKIEDRLIEYKEKVNVKLMQKRVQKQQEELTNLQEKPIISNHSKQITYKTEPLIKRLAQIKNSKMQKHMEVIREKFTKTNSALKLRPSVFLM